MQLLKVAPWGWGFSSVVERLPSKRKALGSVPSSKKKKKEKKKSSPMIGMDTPTNFCTQTTEARLRIYGQPWPDPVSKQHQ